MPPSALSACLFGAIVRDTRGVFLDDEQRLNYFPASPLVALTLVIEGELHMAAGLDDEALPASASPRCFLVPPRDVPTVSWSPGEVLAVTVGFYPDAWPRLREACDVAMLLDRSFSNGALGENSWSRFCNDLIPAWQSVRPGGGSEGMRAGKVADWARSVMVRAAVSGAGRGARAIERRMRRWTGTSRRTLDYFASFEHLHQIVVRSPHLSPAQIAAEAGYADQSHMGRAVRRGTGFSPARLNRLIATEEAFWCYRLLGERF